MTDFETLRHQADDAARAAYRRWEHCKEGELIAISYPWFVRPAHLPISYFELEAAFKLSGGDFETATLMLRVSTERMRRAIIGTKFNRKRKEAPDVDSPVRWTEEPGRRIITVRRMPGDGQDTVSADFNIAGDLVITIQRNTANHQRLVKLAEQVLNESKRSTRNNS
jgi:hypothetical protein